MTRHIFRLKSLHKISFLVALLSFFLDKNLVAQPVMQPYEFFSHIRHEEYHIKSQNGMWGLSSKPMVRSFINFNAYKDSLRYFSFFDTTDNLFERHLFRKNLIEVSSSDYHLAINPVIVFQSNFSEKNKVQTNTRGFWLYGNIGKKFSFESQFMENQVFAPKYLTTYIKSSQVYPGNGRTKPFKDTGFDFAMSSGSIAWQPVSALVIQAGHGKHFIGNGYRSLLLSDNSFNYPFIKTSFQSKFFRYEIVTASLMNIYGGRIITNINSEPTFRKKTASFQYLTFKPNNNMEIGLFNGIIWRASSPANPFFNFSILNPLPFFNALAYGLDGTNNALAGLNLNYRIKKKYLLYGQVLLDEYKQKNTLSFSKNGWQAGLKIFRLFGVKGCVLNIEENHVSAYTYSTANHQQNYVHYNQSLAHPAGANFRERLFVLTYHYGNIFAQCKFTGLLSGRDSTGYLSGSNVLFSDISSSRNSTEFLNGKKVRTTTALFEVGYVINPSFNLQLFLSHFVYTTNESGMRNSETIFSIGLRTALFNTYTDF
jgi:hypothetical protein